MHTSIKVLLGKSFVDVISVHNLSALSYVRHTVLNAKNAYTPIYSSDKSGDLFIIVKEQRKAI